MFQSIWRIWPKASQMGNSGTDEGGQVGYSQMAWFHLVFALIISLACLKLAILKLSFELSYECSQITVKSLAFKPVEDVFRNSLHTVIKKKKKCQCIDRRFNNIFNGQNASNFPPSMLFVIKGHRDPPFRSFSGVFCCSSCIKHEQTQSVNDQTYHSYQQLQNSD